MSKLLINEPPLQVLPSLAVAIGLNEAIFLQQLHYWLTPTAKYKPHYREYEGVSRPWIYNTYHTRDDKKETGWQANFPFWSVRTIKRIVSSLKEKSLVIATDQFNTASSNRTLWYTIDYDKLATYETVSTSGTLDSDKVALSEGDRLALSRGGQIGTLMTETTTEKTTDINGSAKNPLTPQQKDNFDRADQAERDNLNTIADRVAEISKTDIETIGSKTREDLKQLTIVLSKKPNIAAKLNAYEEWWYAKDWRGKQGQPPTLYFMRNTWGQFEAEKVAPSPSSLGPNLSDTAKENYARLRAEAENQTK